MLNGNRVRSLRKKKGVSQRIVSQSTGLTERLLYDIEAGTASNPTLKTLQALSDFYGVSISEFIEEESNA